MKKLLAILLVLVMTLAMGVTAMAEGEEDSSVTPDPITLYKEYEMKGGEAAPVETLTFTVELESGVEGGVDGTPVVKLTADADEENEFETSGEAQTDFVIVFPTYTMPGVYTYTITEVAGNTLGVTYDLVPITVVVTITNVSEDGTTDELHSDVAVHKEDEKIDGPQFDYEAQAAAFKNTYGQGKLTVSKSVSGRFALNSDEFTIHVTFTGENAKSEISYKYSNSEDVTTTTSLVGTGTAAVDIVISNGQSVEFTNIPAGVTYTVEEDDQHFEGNDSPGTAPAGKGYTAEYTFSDEEGKLIEAEDEDTVAINNDKDGEVDTGIFVDSLPYVLIAVGVVAAIGVMIIRKRREMEG